MEDIVEECSIEVGVAVIEEEDKAVAVVAVIASGRRDTPIGLLTMKTSKVVISLARPYFLCF